MNKKRLLKLADLLEADAKNKKGVKFDLAVIAAPAKEEGCYFYSSFGRGAKPEMNCGTAACAVGLATLHPTFNRMGLTYYYNKSDEFQPKFGKHRGWGKAERKFFDLNEHESAFLFVHYSYPTRPEGAKGERAVARRIRSFAAGKISPKTISRAIGND